jgi:hypothetical protein
MNSKANYEMRIFNENGDPSIVVRALCETNTAALAIIARIGGTDFQRVEACRDLEHIYVGRNVPLSNEPKEPAAHAE